MASSDEPALPQTRTELPLFPLNTVLFPGGPLPLRIFEPRYLDLVGRCMRERSAFGVVLIVAGSETGTEATRTVEVGTTARIVDFNQLPDGLLGIMCVGEKRFRILRQWQQDNGLHFGQIEWLAAETKVALPGEYQHLGEIMRKVLPELGELYDTLPKHFDDASWVACRLAEILPISLTDKQYCLELDDPLARLARLSPFIRRSEEAEED
jgi:uncharacterized protein